MSTVVTDSHVMTRFSRPTVPIKILSQPDAINYLDCSWFVVLDSEEFSLQSVFGDQMSNSGWTDMVQYYNCCLHEL
jgi:hypothetical protein